MVKGDWVYDMVKVEMDYRHSTYPRPRPRTPGRWSGWVRRWSRSREVVREGDGAVGVVRREVAALGVRAEGRARQS